MDTGVFCKNTGWLQGADKASTRQARAPACTADAHRSQAETRRYKYEHGGWRQEEENHSGIRPRVLRSGGRDAFCYRRQRLCRQPEIVGVRCACDKAPLPSCWTCGWPSTPSYRLRPGRTQPCVASRESQVYGCGGRKSSPVETWRLLETYGFDLVGGK